MTATPWGYILGVKDPLPSLGLCDATVTVGQHEDCGLAVDARVLPGLSRRHFTVAKSVGGARLTSHSASTFVGGLNVGRNKTIPLLHGSKIAIAGTEREHIAFVFLERAAHDNGAHVREVREVRDRYLVAYSLGHGGFGDVFLTFGKAKPHPRFAMKVVNSTTNNVKFAKREAEILKSLNHPCVIYTYDIIISSKTMYFILELMQGGDLSRWVNPSKPLSERQSKLLFYQLAKAVEYLHDRGITHRDLKPANILLTSRKPETLIKVTDFGLAKDEHLHSQLKTKAGTEQFFAPDILKRPPYTKQVDLWSMGVILFYSLTGALPFGSKDEALVATFHVRYPADQWKTVSCAAMTLVKRMLVVEPEHRATVQEVLAHDWLQDRDVLQQASDLIARASSGVASSGVRRKSSFLNRLFRRAKPKNAQ